jgi:hypothetical protein
MDIKVSLNEYHCRLHVTFIPGVALETAILFRTSSAIEYSRYFRRVSLITLSFLYVSC